MAKKRCKLAVSDASAEFSRLFWAARKEQSQLKEKATKAEPGHKSAVEYAKSQGWEWAEGLLEVSRLGWLGEHEKALSLLTKCEPSVPNQWLGLVHFLRGSALNAKGEHDDAIKAFRKALDDPNYDTLGKAWNNLGVALRAKGEHDNAIEAFRKALDEPVVMASGFPQPFDLSAHPAKIPVRLTPFKVNHGSDVLHAMGMLVELLDKKGKCAMRIGYTGDTTYFPELPKHVADCDLLLAHISQPSIEELQDALKLKEVHLGYRGAVRPLKECRPKLTLIAEFWAGFADLRIPLVKALRQRSGGRRGSACWTRNALEAAALGD